MLRLKELRKEKGLSLKEMGEILGVAESTVSLYESSKREASYSILSKASQYFGVSIDFLIGESSQKETTAILIPVIDSVSLSCDGLEYSYTEEKEIIDIGDDEHHFFFKVHDDLMQPHISAGDIALIKKQSEVENGDLAAVVYENSPVTLKKVVKEGEMTILMPLNQQYQNIFVKDRSKLIILGKVIETIKKW